MSISSKHISVGGNRNPAAADWDTGGTGLLAFGAENSIALWDPAGKDLHGIHLLLSGHTKAVNAVKFFPTCSPNVAILLSGGADNTIRIWRGQISADHNFELIKTLNEHKSPITKIEVLPGSDIFATGASDGTVKIWKLTHDDKFSSLDVELVQNIVLTPKYFPLNLALAKLDEESTILAVAGTKSTIQIFLSEDTQFQLAATLTGHEGWIRALTFTRESPDEDSDLLLASASQDKYIRLWRVHRGEELPAVSNALNDPALGALGKSLSNKEHRIESPTAKYSITFEALLLGHEDWIYTASWRHRNGKLQLLTTSEDNSLAIWESDEASGVWICITRLGEISAQKGSTTATGSAGGFWIGLWSPDGNSVVSLGRTGSWRKWTFSEDTDMWEQQVAITGHVREVKGVCWSRDGSYLLTTSSDQTTRLFAQWKRTQDDSDRKASWHEFSRPQIHGYDLNCISCITDTQFISGADEKLLRVFDEPKAVATLLQDLCDVQNTSAATLQDAANIPVLGLSNKAVTATDDSQEPTTSSAETTNDADQDPPSTLHTSTLTLAHPPHEDHLSRHLLWPETEKLYGHGYEICALAVSHDGAHVATACRASSLDHAVIRLYSTHDWTETQLPLKAHTLTVTSLAFSPNDEYLLSVGRDRQWVVWSKDNATGKFEKKFSDPKGHSRMILGCSWAALKTPTFLTAGRDKSIKIWQIHPAAENTSDEVAAARKVHLKATLPMSAPVTAISCLHLRDEDPSKLVFAYGLETGEIGVGISEEQALDQVRVVKVQTRLSPAKAINQVAWRPRAQAQGSWEVAVASDDSSLRIYGVEV